MVSNDLEQDSEFMLSGIQHFHFCKRQWALIHIEQQWDENVRTIEGQHLHRNADQPFTREKRGNKLIVRAMPIRSNELHVTGVCDVVEFVQDDDGVEIQGASGKYMPILWNINAASRKQMRLTFCSLSHKQCV